MHDAHERVQELELTIEEIIEADPANWECPVCNGAGEVDTNPTNDPQLANPVRCGACNGTGEKDVPSD